jgi:hypothetical protein
MTLERTRELLTPQVKLGSGYNRNATRVILAEVNKKQGQQMVNRLIAEQELERQFGFKLKQNILIEPRKLQRIARPA